jgi:putative transposase
VTLVYLSVTGVFGSLRLLPVRDRDKDVEILVLRHQIAILRQLGTIRPRFSSGDRAFLAALLHRLPQDLLGRIRLLVHPDTVLRWHWDLFAPSRGQVPFQALGATAHCAFSLAAGAAPGRKNPSWGTGASTANCSSWASRSPPRRCGRSSARPGSNRCPTAPAPPSQFLRSQADALLACDFFETVTLGGTRQFVLPSSSTPPAGSGSWAQPLTHRILGRPRREEPGDGSPGRRQQGAIPNPGS